MTFLPATKEEAQDYIGNFDFVLVTGDAYVDHPSFGAAVIGRLLEAKGFKVAILAQPNFKTSESFKIFGRPKLAFLVTSGNIDSMVNHYTVSKKKRRKDLYSPNGEAGHRPDRAVIVYSQKIREAYGNVPIVLGGIEASLRRLAHYDYWDNKLRKSILIESQADLLVYGMGEHQIIEIAEAMQSGIPISELTFIKGTVFKTKDIEKVYDYIELPDYKSAINDKKEHAKSFFIQYKNTDSITAKPLVERYDNMYIVQNTPSEPLSTSEFDYSYGLKYMRCPHPMYQNVKIPAIEEIKFSIISNRGCFGSCNFCALSFHQGRVIQVRSHKSITNEAKMLTYDKDFKGYIHDVGGPTANFRHIACNKQIKQGTCKDKQCLFPTPCKNLNIDHKDYLQLLRKLRDIPNIKKVFVRSGIRYDYLIYDKDETFFTELCQHHISGQLKVAPEHVSEKVLNKMGKPSKVVYEEFCNKYKEINKRLGMNQFIVPYLMSSHPGSDLKAAIELACYLKELGHTPEQVQDFYPTPGTLSTCMYYTELDPTTMEKVYVAKTEHEKALQRALMQYKLPQNYKLVLEALTKAKRHDLIGFEKTCLIRPKYVDKIKPEHESKKKKTKKTIRNVHKKKK